MHKVRSCTATTFVCVGFKCVCVQLKTEKRGCCVDSVLQAIIVAWLCSCVSGLIVNDISLGDVMCVRSVDSLVDCFGLHP